MDSRKVTKVTVTVNLLRLIAAAAVASSIC
jgi:hypothetical protein